MNYCIVNSDNIITNIIIAEETFAKSIGALPYYEGAQIDSEYTPEEDKNQPTQLDRIEAQVAYTAMMTDTLMEV